MTTRELILKRLEELKAKENGFSKSVTRWKNISIDVNIPFNTKHISEVEFSELNDEYLIETFERIIRRYYTQM